MKPTITKEVKKILDKETGIRLDIGCGDNKTPGFVGMDIRKEPGVDIVHDATKFPWPLPDESVHVAVAAHLIEHLPPFYSDSRLINLMALLEKKKILSKKEMDIAIGERDNFPMFMRFMDEVWRVLKYDGEFGIIVPYAGSQGWWQDPTHINPVNEMTMEYFDPLAPITKGAYYRIYNPKPWKIKLNAWKSNGNMEIALIKRRIDKSYTGEEESPFDDFREAIPKEKPKKEAKK